MAIYIAPVELSAALLGGLREHDDVFPGDLHKASRYSNPMHPTPRIITQLTRLERGQMGLMGRQHPELPLPTGYHDGV